MNTRKYLPLFIVLALSVGAVGVYATFFTTWIFNNNLTPVTSVSDTYEGTPQTFHISLAGGNDIALCTVTLTGQGGTSSIVDALCRLEVKSPNWRLESGYTFLLTVKRPDGSILTEITKSGADCPAIGKNASTEYVQWALQFTTNTMQGDYTLFPRITGMVWNTP